MSVLERSSIFYAGSDDVHQTDANPYKSPLIRHDEGDDSAVSLVGTVLSTAAALILGVGVSICAATLVWIWFTPFMNDGPDLAVETNGIPLALSAVAAAVLSIIAANLYDRRKVSLALGVNLAVTVILVGATFGQTSCSGSELAPCLSAFCCITFIVDPHVDLPGALDPRLSRHLRRLGVKREYGRFSPGMILCSLSRCVRATFPRCFVAGRITKDMRWHRNRTIHRQSSSSWEESCWGLP